jgi:hypothetical protein
MKNIGIDVGWTIKGIKGEEGKKNEPMPHSFDVIKKIVKEFDNVYLISKADSRQKAEVEEWLFQNYFFEITGVKHGNLYFCHERRDKSIFAKGLELNYFIDDRPEVMYHLPFYILKYLISASKEDLDKFKDKAISNLTIVKDWLEIEYHLFHNIPDY